ncbi:MAG: ATP-binding protein, partial [Pseudomonadota bacterium]|nr:ATP-binding protein [Pseudomonadota bacterium]
MRSLGFSLILVVVIAIMGIGWLVTEIDFLTSDAELAANAELVPYERMVAALANTLDALPDKQAFLSQWQQRNALPLTLGAAADFPIPPELRADFAAGRTLVLESAGELSVHARLPHSGDVLSLVLPDELVRSTFLRPSLILTLLFYVGVVAAILLWLYPLAQRLLVLRNAAQAFGRGDLHARVEPARFSTIAAIENEFNHMAARIETLIADNKLLGQAVSHNLKTPLARLRFGFEALAETRDDTTREKYAQRIGRDLDEMEALVATLLQYAKLDESGVRLHPENIDLNAFVKQLLVDLDAERVTIEFVEGSAAPHVVTDPNYAAILANNVLANALTYAHARVRVSVMADDAAANILIEDDGPGIPPSERAAVFEPFRRGRNAAPGGHGMGLA